MPVLRARVLTAVSAEQVRYLDDALVVIDGTGRIADIRPPGELEVDEDLRPGLLVPGFVDAHVHYPQTRIVGAASGPLLQWLERSAFPEEARFADADHAGRVAEEFCACLAAAGTTMAMIYGSVHPEAANLLFRALDRWGLRAIAGPVLMDDHSPEALTLPAAEALPALSKLADRWHGHDGRLQVAAIPRFALSCSREMLAGAGSLAAERHLWVTTHLAENPAECEEALRRFDAPDYLSIYEEAGLVGPRSVFAHCIHLSSSEWDRFAEAGAIVAHCPDSNFFLGSGNMPVDAVRSRRIPITIGSDVAGGRSFRIPRILSSAWDNGKTIGAHLTPTELLWWGTRGAALALGESRVGALEGGLDADMALYELPHWVRSEQDALGWLLFDHDAPRPRRTWVRGRVIWERTGGGYPWRGVR